MTASSPQPGTLLAGRYRIVGLLGEGGMGTVYEAENTLTEKRVALKRLHSSFAQHVEARQRLLREALASCRVQHPNVVDVYDVIDDGEDSVLVMEFLEGERLEDLLARGGTPLPALIGLLLPALEGVAEAHRKGVIHRDLHPSNIFLARLGSEGKVMPKVLDFGISKLADEQPLVLTQDGTTLGTPGYTSFEQLCTPREVDGRTDVYAFGVILYRAVTGRMPFEASSFADLAVKMSNTEPVPPKRLCPDLPSGLDRLIMHALERDRERRIDSIETLLGALLPFASESSFRANMTHPERGLPAVAQRILGALKSKGAASETPPAAHTRLGWLAAALALALALALGAVLALSLARAPFPAVRPAPPPLPTRPLTAQERHPSPPRQRAADVDEPRERTEPAANDDETTREPVGPAANDQAQRERAAEANDSGEPQPVPQGIALPAEPLKLERLPTARTASPPLPVARPQRAVATVAPTTTPSAPAEPAPGLDERGYRAGRLRREQVTPPPP